MAVSLSEFLISIQAQNVSGSHHKWKGLCKSHDDSKNSLRVELGASGKVLVYCDVCSGQGKSQGDVLQGLKNASLWPIDVSRDRGTQIALSSAKATERRREIDPRDWVPEPTSPMPTPRDYVGMTVANVHTYRTMGGKVSGSVIRYHSETLDRLGKPEKEFRPLFCFREDGKEVWRTRAPKERPLYGLQRLNHRDKTVLLVEGEKTADVGQAVFPNLVVLSAFGGLNGFQRNDLSPLIDRDVIIWADNDRDWQSNLRAWVNRLTPEGRLAVRSLRTVTLSSQLPEKWDLADPAPPGVDLHKMIAEAVSYVPCPDSVAHIRTLGQLEAGLYQVIDAGNIRYIWNPTKVEFLPSVFDQQFSYLRTDMGGVRPSAWATTYTRQASRQCISKAYAPTNEIMIHVNGEMAYNTYLDPKIPSVEGDVRIWTQFLRFLLGEEGAHIFNCPLANLMQFGNVHDRKCRYATVLVGQQGIGKSIALSVYEKLVGDTNVSRPTTTEIEDRFNAYASNVQVINLVELAGSSQAYHRLMDVIADSEVRIHRKNLEPRTVKNYSVVLGSSNEDVPIKITDETERRWMFLRCKATVADRGLYPYEDVVRWVDSHLPQLKFFYKNYDMGSWEPNVLPSYATEMKRQIVLDSMPPWEMEYVTALKNKFYPLDRDVFTKTQFTMRVGMLYKMKYEKNIIRKHGGGFLKGWVTHGRGSRVEEIYVVRDVPTYEKLSPEELGRLVVSGSDYSDNPM